MSEIKFYNNIIIGGGPSGLQLAYFFSKNNIEYLLIEKENTCGSFFNKYPHSSQLISINKKFTGSDNPDFNLRHDWNSLLNDENHLFKTYTDEFYPNSKYLYEYLNDFHKQNNFNIIFNTTISSIDKIKSDTIQYKLNTSNNDIKYICNKLIIATGLSIPIIPNFKINVKDNIKHYSDFPYNFFNNSENLKEYENKKILIVGGGNASYEIANILNKYCSSILILGNNKDFSISSHYSGDLRSIYYKFLDTFYLKSLNAIDNLSTGFKNFTENISITQITDKEDINYNKYIIKKFNTGYYANENNNIYDKIIFCTGWKFNSKIFNFNLLLTNNLKYPNIKYNYESINNNNLYFIGTLMHSLDFKKSSGGFIHGFRYLIKLFTQINYNIPFDRYIFKLENTKQSLIDISKHIMKRINTSSSIYQMYGIMCDIFYYDKKDNNIVYINDLSMDYINNNFKEFDNYYILQLNYGEKIYDLKIIGDFNKYNPVFLHPEIMTFSKINNNIELMDKIILEEDLYADFSSENYFNKILNTLKGFFIFI